MANKVDRRYREVFGDDGAGAPAWLKKEQLRKYEAGMVPEEIRPKIREEGEKVIDAIELPEEGGAEVIEKTAVAEKAEPEKVAPEVDETEAVAARDEALSQDREEMLEAAKTEGYKLAQEEMAQVLAGRSIEQALKDFDAEIEKLEGEIAQMQTVMPADGSRKYYENMIAEAQGDLASLERRRQMIENLQHGGDAVEALEPKELSQQAAGGELGDLNPQSETLVQETDVAEQVESPVREPIELEFVVDKKKDLAKEAITEDTEKIRQLKEQIELKREARDAVQDEGEKAALGHEIEGLVQRLNGTYAQLYQRRQGENVVPAEEKVEKVPNSNAEKIVAVQELSAEKREELQEAVFEKVKKRNGFKRISQRVKAAVATIFMTAVVGLGLSSNVNSAEAASLDSAPVAVTQTVETATPELNLEDVVNQIAAGVNVDAGSSTEAQQEAQEFLNETGVRIQDIGNLEELANYEKLENGTFYNYDEYYGYGDMGAKVTPNSFGLSKVGVWETKDPSSAANSIYKMAHDQPEALASMVKYFPSLLVKCGLPADASAEYIDTELSKGENGGELQKNLLEGFKEILEDESTQIEFTTAQGRVWTPYMQLAGDKTPVGHILGLDQMTRENSPQVVVRRTVTKADGSKVVEEVYYNADCGWQPNEKIAQPDMPPDDEPEEVVIEEVVPEPEPDPTPVPTPEPTPDPTPEPTPEPTPDPTPEPDPTPDPEPDPDPDPSPDPIPEPTPDPTPDPEPDPTPEPTPDPTPEPTPDPTPEPIPEPTPEPTPEPGPEETVKPKDPDSLIENGSLGVGDNNVIDKTPNIDEMPEDQVTQVGDGQIDREEITGDQTGTYEVTDEPTVDEDNQEIKVDNAVTNETLTPEEQDQLQQEIDNAEAAADAMEEEGARPTTEDEIDDYLQQLLNNPMDNNGEMDG